MSESLTEIGNKLRNKRKKKKVKFADVEKELNIKPAYIKAMEEGRFDFTGPTYVLGYLKIYSKFLNLNSKEILKEFKQTNSELLENHIKTLQSDPYDQDIRPTRLTIAISIILTFIIYFFWYQTKVNVDISAIEQYKKSREQVVIDKAEELER